MSRVPLAPSWMSRAGQNINNNAFFTLLCSLLVTLLMLTAWGASDRLFSRAQGGRQTMDVGELKRMLQDVIRVEIADGRGGNN